MPPGAPIHRGQNSCSMCIMSAVNGNKYAIKHYGSDAILAEEQELFTRTPVHMVCPQVRHLDAKNHRHLLQSAVCITPALKPLDKYIERHRSAFSRRPEQVCSAFATGVCYGASLCDARHSYCQASVGCM